MAWSQVLLFVVTRCFFGLACLCIEALEAMKSHNGRTSAGEAAFGRQSLACQSELEAAKSMDYIRV